MGQAPDGSEAERLKARDACAESDRSRSLCSILHTIPKDGVHANISQRASPDPEPKPVRWCILEAVPSAEAELSATKPPRWISSAEAVESAGALPGRCADRATEATRFAQPVPESCLPPIDHRSDSSTQDTQYGIRRLLPWGSSPFGVSARAIVMSVYLTDTVRSQGFSPSQRFDPARTSWLYFTPHPPLGFRNGLQSFSPSVSRDASRRPLLSCRFGRLQLLSSELEMGLHPRLWLPRFAQRSPPLLQWLPVHPQK